MNRRWSVRTVLGIALVCLLSVLVAAPASGHDVLSGSDPADGSMIASAPERVTLTFNEAPNPASVTVTVVGPNGSRWERGASTADGKVVSVALSPLGPAGRYEVGYRVLSSDGHPISGATSFTMSTAAPGVTSGGAPVASPAAPAPAQMQAPSAGAQPQPASSSADSTDGPPAWVFVVLAIVVIAAAVALTLRRKGS